MITAVPDRRRGRRAPPTHAGWRADALIRPGLPVLVLNVGRHGVLVECPARLRPGRRAEVQFVSATSERKLTIHGRVERCIVKKLNPLTFHGAIAFETELPDS